MVYLTWGISGRLMAHGSSLKIENRITDAHAKRRLSTFALISLLRSREEGFETPKSRPIYP